MALPRWIPLAEYRPGDGDGRGVLYRVARVPAGKRAAGAGRNGVPRGSRAGGGAALLPAGTPLRDAAAFLEQHGFGDCRIPLSPRLPEQPAGGEVVLFEEAAEYAGQYANVRLIFVSPPGYFTLPERTEKLFLPRFQREPALETQAEERKIPLLRY